MARVVTGTLNGLSGLRVRVEVDLAADLPGFFLVGLPSTAMRESRERVGAALRHSGFHWPDRRITVNLAPADVRKDGGALDLAVAAALLLASGQVNSPGGGLLRRTLMLGELSLDGVLRPARGLLALALDAARLGVDRLLVPACQRASLEAVPGLRVVALDHLGRLDEALQQLARRGARTRGDLPAAGAPRDVDLILGGVRGQVRAKRGVILAAAGGHHLALVGPPGCGKTMLARCLPGLLPPLGDAVLAERLRILSAVGHEIDLPTVRQRPLRAPHHTVSEAGLVGGGRPPRPGEVTLAHRGVLLLDEATEFGRRKLDLLREPLESGRVRVARAGESLVYPARFQLVLTCNPCPCGYLGSRQRECLCSPRERDLYRRRLSGPLRDRIDLWIELDREPAGRWWRPEKSKSGLGDDRLGRAQARGLERGEDNARLEGEALRRACALTPEGQELAEEVADRLGLSVRGLVSALRVARTIADGEGRARVARSDLAEALSFRAVACDDV